MKKLHSSVLCLVVMLLTPPLLRAQDFSKYRHFTLGMNLTSLLERTGQKMVDVKIIHDRPALIQEVTWWAPNIPGTSLRSDNVEQIVFSFYNGELYKISVTYDSSSTAGLTEGDMVRAISAKYGPATMVPPEIGLGADTTYDTKQKPVASWEDAQYSLKLVRFSFTEALGLVVFSKRADAQAELASAEAVKLDEQEGPKREAEREKKQTEDLEMTRRKNQKSFRP